MEAQLKVVVVEKKKQLENKAKEFLTKHEEAEAKKNSATRDGKDKKNRFFSKSISNKQHV